MPAAAPPLEARRPVAAAGGAAAAVEQAASSRRAPQPLIHGSALRPTHGQAELNDDEDGGGDGAAPAGARRREEPRSVEAAGPLRVLYEGHDLIIIDKPPDVRMQGPFDVTVETLVRHWCPEAAPASVGLKWIHQLDHATSGVLCIGLSRKVAAAAGDLFARRVVAKEYVALLEGHLDVAALPLREEAEIYCAKGDDAAAGAGAGGYYNEASLSGIRLEVRRPHHKLGVIYKPASSFYREKQLAVERRQKEDGASAALGPTEAALLGTKWREARTALPEVVAECEALAAADKARAAAAMEEQKRRQQKGQEAAHTEDGEGDDGTSEQEDGGSPGVPVRRRQGKEAEAEAEEAERPMQDLGAFRRPRDPEGSFVVDVAITELKHDFRVRLGLPSSKNKDEPTTSTTSTNNNDNSKAAFDPNVYNTGPRRARTLGRVLAPGFLRLPGQEGEGRAVTKVLLRPVTGRRHQLRVHSLHMGHPIVGDTTYTGDTAALRMMLHAASLTLPFPAGKGPGCTVSIKTAVDPFEPYFQAI